LKRERLKHVSEEIVTCLGGGEGKESEYAEAEPKGGAGIVRWDAADCEVKDWKITRSSRVVSIRSGESRGL